MSKRRLLVRTLFEHYVRRLRVVLAREGATFYAEQPDAQPPCHSCAFMPSTDGWTGFLATMVELHKALDEERPFFCHHGMALNEETGTRVPPMKYVDGVLQLDLEKIRFCSGWQVIAYRPGVAEAFEEACDETMFATARELGGTWDAEMGGEG
jgi:hypothetical protein